MLVVIALSLVMMGLAPTGTAQAAVADARQQEKEAELSRVRARIQELRANLDQARGQRQSLGEALREAEEGIGQVSRRVRGLESELGAQQKTLAELLAVRQLREQELTAERQRLAQQVRAAHALGRHDKLRLILNQEDPARMERMLAYYEYLSRERARRVVAVEDKVQALEAARRALSLHTRALERLKEKRLAEHQSLLAARAQREEALAALNRDMELRGAHLESLLRDEKELQSLITALGRILEGLPPPGAEKPLAIAKGKLAWPAQGRISLRFGERRMHASQAANGVVIAAPAGGEVRAVAGGRVAFSDWLRGYGLLVIVDHGHEFMTLYGHNESVFKEAGEWVEAGEVIASVGSSGGLARAGLYFELRHQGKPQNPVQWCAGLPKPPRVARDGS
jgi:septal ring factor EnvC (AmiA/AmiB activator)